MNNIFIPEDFNIVVSVEKYMLSDKSREVLADMCNCKLKEIISNWPIVYGTKIYETNDQWTFSEEYLDEVDTHMARLGFIEEIKPEHGEIKRGMKLFFDKNSIKYRQDFSQKMGLPEDIIFEIVEVDAFDQYSSIRLTAIGYGKIPYGNGGIYVNTSDLRDNESVNWIKK